MRYRYVLLACTTLLTAFILALTSAAGGHHPTPQTPEKAQSALSGEEIRTLLSGNTFEGSFGAKPFTFYYQPDGVVYGTLGIMEPGPDSGVWKVEHDLYCHHWREIFDYVEHCYSWHRSDGKYLLKNVDTFRYWDLEGHIIPGKPPGY